MSQPLTPADAGFFMPPEWAPHECCWMAWPCRPDGFWDFDAARDTVARVAREIARREPVRMIANAADAEEAARQCASASVREAGPHLHVVGSEAHDGSGGARGGSARGGSARSGSAGTDAGSSAGAAGTGAAPDSPHDRIEIVVLPTDDSWTRDTAPTFVVDDAGRLAGVDWVFNSYGGLHDDCGRTAEMAHRICERLGVRRFRAPLVLEGGAIHTDGEGTLLTTEQVVLDPRRNPGLSKTNAEEVLRDYLGVEKVIWLTAVLDGDNTGGHVDNLACFAAPGLVVAFSVADPRDPQYAAAQENLDRLRAATDARGRALEIVELRQPARPVIDGGRLSPSYVNYYLANGAVIVPGFDDPMDERARETLAVVFPDREIVQIETIELARVAGNIHCITQQQPAT
jgi:agmatine deiminase